MFVNNQSSYPYYIGINPYKATVGLATEFVIKRSFYTQYNAWPFDYSECLVDEHDELLRPLDDPSLFELVTAQSPNFAYMRQVCYELCYQEGLAKRCNCSQYNIKMQVSSNLSQCLPPIYGACEQRFRETEFFRNEYFQQNCISRCPLECHKAQVDFTPHTYFYPPTAANAEQNLAAAGRLWTLRANQSEFSSARTQNLVRLVFYLDSLSYTNVDEEPKMTVDTLIGTIGGHLHLFLGMSLLSFVEIAVIAIKFVHMQLTCCAKDRVDPFTKRSLKNLGI